MSRICTDYPDNAMTFNYFAFAANFLHRNFYFHKPYLIISNKKPYTNMYNLLSTVLQVPKGLF